MDKIRSSKNFVRSSKNFVRSSKSGEKTQLYLWEKRTNKYIFALVKNMY